MDATWAHFRHLGAAERARLFDRVPEAFGPDADAALLGTLLGATLYVPGDRPHLARDITRQAAAGVLSVIVCLEDAVADRDLAAAERNVIAALHELRPERSPMVFVRVRMPEQLARIAHAAGERAVLAGFVVPKFGEDARPGQDEGGAFFEAVLDGATRAGRRLLVMPILESAELAHAETRTPALLGARRVIDKYAELVPAVRVGATDLAAAFGLRTPRGRTVWDVGVVAEALISVVNVFGRAAAPYVVAGPVHEQYADASTLLREVELDRVNGLTGKSVVHPAQVAPVHALSVVSHEDDCDARAVLSATDGGVAASSYGTKMNEHRPHAVWARRTVARARAFGVARPGVGPDDLLAALRQR